MLLKKAFFPLFLYNARKNDYGASYLNYNDLKKIIKKKKEGKTIILIIHGGKELAKSSKELRIDIEKLNSMGASLIVIHHPHTYLKTKFEKDNIFVIGYFIFNYKDHLPPNRKSATILAKVKNNTPSANLIKFKNNEIYDYNN